MGMLSKKRKQPRNVKKRRRNDKKHKRAVAPRASSYADLWSGEKTPQQNFKDMGLVLNSKPSMRQTNIGKALQTEARVRLNKKHYEKQGLIPDDVEQVKKIAEAEKAVVPKTDLTTVFPEIKAEKDAIIRPTVRKLKEDEKEICKRLLKKYGTENYRRMAMDIKVNYLQWSKGQCAKNCELYRIHIGELDANYKVNDDDGSED